MRLCDVIDECQIALERRLAVQAAVGHSDRIVIQLPVVLEKRPSQHNFMALRALPLVIEES